MFDPSGERGGRRIRSSSTLIGLGLLLLTGCQGTPVRDVDSPRFKVPPGSTVTLNRPLQTDPGSARAYIQFGRPVSLSETRQRYPRCLFFLDTVSEQPQTIEPGEFEVVETRQLRRVCSLPAEQVVAAVGFGFVLGGGESDENFATHMRLRSEQQPEVRELICEVLTTTADVMRDHLTISDIRQTLGDVATLRLAGSESAAGGADR